MEVFFLGVGEACDTRYPNTSLLLNTESGKKSVLLDCGFTTPHLYFKQCSNPNELRALWISHFHGDHFFGVPLLLLRFWEMDRHEPLFVLGPQHVRQKVFQAMDLAYPGFLGNLNFSLKFHEVEPASPVHAAGLLWSTAENQHSERSLAVRLGDGAKSLFYSGDGRPTRQTCDLARGCGLAVHEAFRFNQDTAGHGSVAGCLDFAGQAGIPHLALVHLERRDRELHADRIRETIQKAEFCNVFLPEPGDTFSLQ